jgi:hypothetical protein
MLLNKSIKAGCIIDIVITVFSTLQHLGYINTKLEAVGKHYGTVHIYTGGVKSIYASGTTGYSYDLFLWSIIYYI